MFYSSKAYLNARGGPSVLVLSHDVKRCISDSQVTSGQLNIVSTQATTGVALFENDAKIHEAWLEYAQKQFAEANEDKVSRRSGAGATKFHLMAALTGISLTLPNGNSQRYLW
mgnify:CR=1 FL=1